MRLSFEDWTLLNASHITHHYEKDGTVIRVNRNYDYGFANYAELSLHVPSPHFLQFGWHTHLEDDTHVALFEKLEPVPSDRQASPAIRGSLRALWQLGNYILPFSEDDFDHAGYPALIDRSQLIATYEESYLRAQLKDIAAQSPSLAEAVQLAEAYLLKLNQDDTRFVLPVIDLSPRNLMIRRDATTNTETIVIADPYAYDFHNNYGTWEDVESYDALHAVFALPSLPRLKTYKFEHSIT